MQKALSTEQIGPFEQPAIGLTLETFRQVCVQFIERLPADGVRRLCWSGSLWIEIDAALSEKVHPSDLFARGLASDQLTHQAGWQTNSILAADFDGFAEQFVLDDDVDADNNPIVPDNITTVMYSTEVGRAELIAAFQNSADGHYDSLVERLTRHLEDE